MRGKSPQNLAIIFTLFYFLLLSQLQIIHATQPQKEIFIQSENAHIYDVFVPIEHNNEPNLKTIALPLPSYLRKGFITDETTCYDDDEKESLICTNPGIPTELHFRWDTHSIMEGRYCEAVTGQKQLSKVWAGRYMFKRTDTFPWIRSVLIHDLHVNDGSLMDTHADLTTNSGYVVLWSFGSALGDRVEFGGNSTNKPLLGKLESIQGNPTTLYIIDRNKHSVGLSSAKIITCSVADITTEIFDQPVSIDYFGEDVINKIETIDFVPLHFEYETLTSQLSPTETPTPTFTMSPTQTSTPTPTPNVVVVYSATAPPTPSVNSKTEILNSNTGVTETPTFTPTPITRPNSNNQITSSNDNEQENNNESPNSVEKAGGEVLGASTGTPEIKSESAVVSMLLWIGAMLVTVTVAVTVTVRRKNRRQIIKQGLTGILFFGIWIIGSCKVYASAPQLLVKITDPRTYYARSTSGSIDLITYPPNFYFTGAVAGGRVVLSSTQDGTGNVSLGNGGFLTRTLTYWSSTANFGMNPPTNKGDCNAAQNLPPRELPIEYFNSPNTTYNVRATFQGYCPRSTPWQVSDLYLVYFPPEPTATPTLTPTPTYTPTPTPTTVPPFLDLPWDYVSDDWTYSDALLNITTFFDHEYPFISANLTSPDFVVRYKGDKLDKPYSSHDGYDYANYAKVSYGDDQLAAAGGTASYHYDRFSGHAIFIDHGNGFQTRYYHMQPTDLIINTIGNSVAVRAGQKIGKVGYSGNVDPVGIGGAHIHFMVIFDKNHDGNFQDNIPDGIVDPFGWQGEGADPWETFQFDYAGQKRTGMKSTYLWKLPISSTNKSIDAGGGTIQNEKITVEVPPNTTIDLLQFYLRFAPRIRVDTKLESVGSIGEITAVDGGGVAVKSFAQPINISFTYSEDDALYYDPDHMSVYSSPDGAIWEKEQTLINHDTRTATATVDHLTYFALMGEKRDNVAPQTTIQLTGQGKEMNFRSNVTLELQPQDPCSDENDDVCHAEPVEASTIDYTLVKLDDGEWDEYTKPVTVSTEGTHTFQYFSADTSGNVENTQTVEFAIDQTMPEIDMQYDPGTQLFTYTTDSDATVYEPSEGIVIAQDSAGNINELHYHKKVEDSLTTVEFVDAYAGLYAVSNEYEYFQSGDVSVRKIPTDDGRLSIGTNDEISEDSTTTSLHIITNRGTLKIHD